MRHQRDDRRRIDAARQERAKRNIGNEPQANRFGQPFDQLSRELAWRSLDRWLVGARQPPVARYLAGPVSGPAIGLDDQPMRGRQFADRGKRGARRGYVLQAQVIVEGGQINAPVDAGPGQDGLDLRSENQNVAGATPIERLLAEAIADEQQLAGGAVP